MNTNTEITQIYGNPDDFECPVSYEGMDEVYTPYHQWKDRVRLRTTFIINDASTPEWVMVELDERATANYHSKIARCRWYITCNLYTDDTGRDMRMMERVPETDEMLYETITGMIDNFRHPNIYYCDKEITTNTEVARENIIDWKCSRDSVRVQLTTGEMSLDEDEVNIFKELPHTKISNRKSPDGTEWLDLWDFEEHLRTYGLNQARAFNRQP